MSAEKKEHRDGYVVTILMTEACDGGQTSLSLQQIHLVVEMHLCINNIEAGICGEPSHCVYQTFPTFHQSCWVNELALAVVSTMTMHAILVMEFLRLRLERIFFYKEKF